MLRRFKGLFLLLMVLVLTSNTAFAAVDINLITQIEEGELNVLSNELDVKTNKKWTINFSNGVDPKTVTNESVIIWDKVEQAPVDAFMDVEGESILLYPKKGYFKEEHDYTIYVVNSVKSVNGKKLMESTKKEFSTAKNVVVDSSSIQNLKASKSAEYITNGGHIVFTVSGIGSIANDDISFYEVDAKGNIIASLGFMKDDGKLSDSGDDVKGDGVYSYKYEISN